MPRDTIVVWETCETVAEAASIRNRLTRQRPDLTFHRVLVSSPMVPRGDAVRAKEQGHRFAVGPFAHVVVRLRATSPQEAV